jgi:16S rRNA processing protein RimM
VSDGRADGDAGSGLVAVGKVGPARGVHGEVFVEPWTDAPQERFAPGAVVRTDRSDPATLTVEAAAVSSGKQVVHFAGVEDRPAAEALRGVVLHVAAAQRPPLEDPDEYYDTDLIGLTARDEDGTVFGPVVDVVHAAGATYLVLKVDGRERMVPFVAAIVPHVDLAAGEVHVAPPEGLFEL